MINSKDSKLKFKGYLKNIEEIRKNLPQQKDEISTLDQKIIALIKFSFTDYEKKISEFKRYPRYTASSAMSEQEIEDNDRNDNLRRLNMMRNSIVGYVEELSLLIKADTKNTSHDIEENSNFSPNTAFVVMAIGKDNSDVVYDIINKECIKLEINATRADKISGSGNITNEIISSIKESEFIIVDLTHERPNVYYELGYAHGVGNEGHNILLIAKKGTKIHFNISTFRVKFYEDSKDLHDIVYSNLKKMILKTR